MRKDRAEQLASQIRGDDPGREVRVVHVPDGAPEPFGFVLEVDGQRFSSPAVWAASDGGEDGTVSFNLRLPGSLVQALDQMAAAHGRARSSEITYALRQHVEDFSR